LLAFTALTS